MFTFSWDDKNVFSKSYIRVNRIFNLSAIELKGFFFFYFFFKLGYFKVFRPWLLLKNSHSIILHTLKD